MDFDSETLVAHTLKGAGFDGSEDGSGRGGPLVPMLAPTLGASADRGGTMQDAMAGALIAFSSKDYGNDAREDLAPTLRAMGHKGSHANAGGHVAVAFHARQDPDISGEITPPLDTDGSSIAAAFAENSRAELRLEGGDGQTTGSLKTGGGKPGQSYPVAMQGLTVRRLTPRECERLMGMPDDYTLVPYRGKPAADGPRYKATGNSIAVPCLEVIGRAILSAQSAVEGE